MTRKCANPLCRLDVSKVGKRYCSQRCYSFWSQKISKAAQILGATDQVALRLKIRYVTRTYGQRAVLNLLGLTPSALTQMMETLDRAIEHAHLLGVAPSKEER